MTTADVDPWLNQELLEQPAPRTPLRERLRARLGPVAARLRRAVPDRFTAVQAVGGVAFSYGAVDTFGVGVGLMIVGPLVFGFSVFAEWAGSRSS